MADTPVTDAAIDAAVGVVPDRHLGFPGGWEPAISRDCVRSMLEAAAPLMGYAAGGAAALRIRELEDALVTTVTPQPGDRIIIKVARVLTHDMADMIIGRVRHVLHLGPDIPVAVTDGETTLTAEPDPQAARIAELQAVLDGLARESPVVPGCADENCGGECGG